MSILTRFCKGEHLWFSGVDDRHEREMAGYIHKHLPETAYGSIVMNRDRMRARVWQTQGKRQWCEPVSSVNTIDFPMRRIDPTKKNESNIDIESEISEVFDRQIRAFGADGQARMAEATVAVVGCGGIGSIVVEGLVRLGFERIDLIDPDVADMTNLNRVAGMRYQDAVDNVPKVEIAARMTREIRPTVRVGRYCLDALASDALECMRRADLIVVATDNNASRLVAQRVGVQYLIPVVHCGVNLEAEDGRITDISGEFAVAMPGAGGWCLACAHAFDPQIAAWELSTPNEQAEWVRRGYVEGADVPSPAVRHLNGVTADLALAEIHNLFTGFKQFHNFVSYDQLKCELMPLTIERNKSCAFCGDRRFAGPRRPGTHRRLPAASASPAEITSAARTDQQGACNRCRRGSGIWAGRNARNGKWRVFRWCDKSNRQ
jgi:molybdopterin/thiamine biosynthesis adenylyltransferase